MDIDYLIDQLESLRDRGIQVPLTKMVLIDEEHFLRLINQLRISVPKEVQEAKQLQQDRDRIIAQAQERAQNIVALAEQQAEELIGEHPIAQRAEERERSILERAHQEAADIRAEADAYALRVLEELQEQLISFQNTVRNGIELLKQSQRERAATAEAEMEEAQEPAEEPEEAPTEASVS
ncbi:MAG: ATPase [Chloroflexi bacterium]|nr:MAG: ATPase [Chloroflexota bacterium]